MVAIAYTDITPTSTAQQASLELDRRPAGDPLVDAAIRLLSVPVQQLYALLWRAGLLVVDD
jgi:hypothetical protein